MSFVLMSCSWRLDPDDERVVPKLAGRRARAEHLCLWLACTRAICRRTRHCRGREALCVFENPEVTRPLLE
jgi:hypothetical protein